MKFNWRHLVRLDLVLSSKFESLGSWIARSPGTFILFPILMTLLMGSGLQKFNYAANVFYLFVPVTAQSIKDAMIIETLFPPNASRHVQGSELKRHELMEFILIPKEGYTALSEEVWQEAQSIVDIIGEFQVYLEGHYYSWTNLCLKFADQCVGNSFLSLYSHLMNGSIISNLKYPIMTDPEHDHLFHPIMFHFGGVQTDDRGSVTEAAAMKLIFMVDDSTPIMRRASLMFLGALHTYFSNVQLNTSSITVFSPTDVEKELINNIQTAFMNHGSLIIIIICAFTLYSCMRTDWVRSKPLMGVVGLFCILLAALSGFGLCLYLGYPWQAINVVVIVLLIGIGMDGIFLLLSSWSRSESVSRDLVTRMSVTYSDAAVSLTITQLTNILSFVVGAAVPGFPCVEIFCIYAASGLVFCYLWTITLFGAFLALSGHLEHSNRHSLLMMKVESKSMAEANSSSWLYKLFLVGGIDPADPSNAKDNKEEKMMAFFRNVIAPILNHNPFKALILVFFVLYLMTAGLGIYHMKEGLQLSNLAMEDSHVIPHYALNNKFFRDYTYRLQVVLTEEIDYQDKEVQDQLVQMLSTLESSEYISNNTNFRQFWLTEFLEVAKENFILFDISTKESFMTNLKIFMEEIHNFTISADVQFNEEGTEVTASRLFLQTNRIEDSQVELKMLLSLRELAASLPFKVILFHPLFYIFDQFAEVFNQMVCCVCLCVAIMAVIILLFIPSKICVIWVVFAVISVEVGVLGMMSYFGINLDVISMIVLIMGIGFSVDFSAHISYHYLSADQDHDPEERLAHCLHALGPPILQGAATTILAVLPLISHPSYVIITFTKMIILVIVLGLLHGLLLLPVLLTLFGPGSCSGSRRPSNNARTQSKVHILSPIAAISETFVYTNGTGDKSLNKYTMKKCKAVTPEALKSNLVRQMTATVTRSPTSNLHLSFFKPSESDVSDLSAETQPMKMRGYSDSSFYSYQKRHLRRSDKTIKSRARTRAASEGDVVDSPRDAFRVMMSDLRNFTPRRSFKSKFNVKSGAENRAFEDPDIAYSSFNGNDVSLLSSFRPHDLQNAVNNNNNSIRRETKLVLIDHDQSVHQSNDYSDDDSFDNSSLGSK